jgi:glutamate racemase
MARIAGQPIGILDSGLGGLTVLADLVYELPGEHYIYYADTKFAPYGMKSRLAVQKRVTEVTGNLISYGIKALVIACNTATSAAAELLRSELSIPVIGMEPALKQAVSGGESQSIIVAATPLTLEEKKFMALYQEMKGPHEVIPLPCHGLVELIESDGPDSPLIDHKLQELLQPFVHQTINRLVLGCTHYVLIRTKWQQAVGPDTKLIDGNSGTVRQTMRLLAASGSAHQHGNAGTRITLLNSLQNDKLRKRYKDTLCGLLKQKNIRSEIVINEE